MLLTNVCLKDMFKCAGRFLDCPQLDFCHAHVLRGKTKTKCDAELQHIQIKVFNFILIRDKRSIIARTLPCLVPYQLLFVSSKGNNSPGMERDEWLPNLLE